MSNWTLKMRLDSTNISSKNKLSPLFSCSLFLINLAKKRDISYLQEGIPVEIVDELSSVVKVCMWHLRLFIFSFFLKFCKYLAHTQEKNLFF